MKLRLCGLSLCGLLGLSSSIAGAESAEVSQEQKQQILSSLQGSSLPWRTIGMQGKFEYVQHLSLLDAHLTGTLEVDLVSPTCVVVTGKGPVISETILVGVDNAGFYKLDAAKNQVDPTRVWVPGDLLPESLYTIATLGSPLPTPEELQRAVVRTTRAPTTFEISLDTEVAMWKITFEQTRRKITYASFERKLPIPHPLWKVSNEWDVPANAQDAPYIRRSTLNITSLNSQQEPNLQDLTVTWQQPAPLDSNKVYQLQRSCATVRQAVLDYSKTAAATPTKPRQNPY